MLTGMPQGKDLFVNSPGTRTAAPEHLWSTRAAAAQECTQGSPCCHRTTPALQKPELIAERKMLLPRMGGSGVDLTMAAGIRLPPGLSLQRAQARTV